MSKLPVAVQVYGLRDLLQDTPERFEEVMKAVKEIGYDGVELAGLYGLEPAYIHEVLDKTGLVPISAHVPFNELLNDLDKAVADYKTIGVQYMVMPHMPQEYRPVNPEGRLEGASTPAELRTGNGKRVVIVTDLPEPAAAGEAEQKMDAMHPKYPIYRSWIMKSSRICSA